MHALILLLAGIGSPGQGDLAPVTFVNQTSFSLNIFLKRTRQTLGPIKPREHFFAEGAFALGENEFLVTRELGPDGRASLKEFAAIVPGRHMLYRAAEGRGPAPVEFTITHALFRSLKKQDLETDFHVANETGYPITIFRHGQAAGLGQIRPGGSRTFNDALAFGRTKLVAIAQRHERPDQSDPPKTVDIAYLEINVPKGARKAPSLVITNRHFGPKGLPPKLAPPPPAPPKLTLDGTWKQPDGLVCRFESSNGYWVEVLWLADFGFKPGERGFRNIKEDPAKPGYYAGEVLYRFRGGQIDGWKPFSIRVVDKTTASDGSATWKRIS